MQRIGLFTGALAALLALSLASCGGGGGSIVVIPGDTTAPTVAFTGISNGDSLSADRSIQIFVADSENAVTLVEVLVDNTLIASTACNLANITVPFVLAYDAQFAGPHTVGARVRDAAGNSTISTVNFTILP